MCTVLLIGANTALLEGLAQALASVGHRAVLAGGLAEAAEVAVAARPLLAVVERELATRDGAALRRVPLAPGGSVVLYSAARGEGPALPAAVQRAALADLALPLERQRLLALVQHVEGRATAVGRARRDTPPEVPRIG